jgi:hypothetical protein
MRMPASDQMLRIGGHEFDWDAQYLFAIVP